MRPAAWLDWRRWWPGREGRERAALRTVVMPLVAPSSGLPAQWWPLHGEPLLWHALREACDAGCRRVMLVGDQQSARWRRAMAALAREPWPQLQVRFVQVRQMQWLQMLSAVRPALRHEPFAVLMPTRAAAPAEAPLVRLAEQFARLHSSLVCVAPHATDGVPLALAGHGAPLARVRSAGPGPDPGEGRASLWDRAVFTPAAWRAWDDAQGAIAGSDVEQRAAWLAALLRQELVFGWHAPQPLYDVLDARQWLELQTRALDRQGGRAHFLPQTAPGPRAGDPAQRHAVGASPSAAPLPPTRPRLVLVHSKR